MKKTVKSLSELLIVNREFLADKSEKVLEEYGAKNPKVIVLSCPYPLRFLGNTGNWLYAVTSYGGAVEGNEITLDHAVKALGIPVCVILGHEDCSAVRQALKGEAATKGEAALFNAIAPAFEEGKARKVRDNILKHIDYQVSLLLERYRTPVKEDKLLIAGVFCDAKGSLSITNYNGLRGWENLSQAMPDVDAGFFLG